MFGKKAKEAAQAFHDRALRAEQERDEACEARDRFKRLYDDARESQSAAMLEQGRLKRAMQQAIRERDEAKTQLAGQKVYEERNQVIREQDEARADREALRDQLQAVTAERDEAKRQHAALRADLDAMKQDRDNLFERANKQFGRVTDAERKLETLMAERDSLWQDMETIHEITSKHMGDNDDA